MWILYRDMILNVLKKPHYGLGEKIMLHCTLVGHNAEKIILVWMLATFSSAEITNNRNIKLANSWRLLIHQESKHVLVSVSQSCTLGSLRLASWLGCLSERWPKRWFVPEDADRVIMASHDFPEKYIPYEFSCGDDVLCVSVSWKLDRVHLWVPPS